MFIPEKTISDTSVYIVNQYQRETKANPANDYYEEAKNKLSGLSILLVGRKEKKHVEQALKQLDKLRSQKNVKK